jgi:hypothetical protein
VPTRKEEYERIGAERDEAEREMARGRLRNLLRGGLLCVASAVAGLVIMFFAFWVNDETLGRAFLYAGMAVGYAGMAYALLSTYSRGEKRGDW